MSSPGAPSHRREIERRFWEQIATGITSEKAAQAVEAHFATLPAIILAAFAPDVPLKNLGRLSKRVKPPQYLPKREQMMQAWADYLDEQRTLYVPPS